jgi:hypothetical protein
MTLKTMKESWGRNIPPSFWFSVGGILISIFGLVIWLPVKIGEWMYTFLEILHASMTKSINKRWEKKWNPETRKHEWVKKNEN